MDEQDQAQSLSHEEHQALVERAFELQRAIADSKVGVQRQTWALAKALYEFHELGGWGLLGHETLNEWLASPEVDMGRNTFFRLVRTYRDFAVVRQLPAATLELHDPRRLDEVRRAVMRGKVTVEDALSDCEALGSDDLRRKYSGKPELEQPQEGDEYPAGTPAPAGSTAEELDETEAEPPDAEGGDDLTRVECPTCGSLVDPDRLEPVPEAEVVE